MDGGTSCPRAEAAMYLPGRIESIDPAEWDDVWIVGDVHGCLDALERLLSAVDPGPEDLLVFVGDLVRKGPDSEGVCGLVRDMPTLRSVRGNNEQKLLDGRASLPGLTAASERFLEDLPLGISIGEDLVVHGGLDHRKSPAEHTVTDLLTMRSFGGDNGYERPYWFERRRSGRRVFFGHTVLARPFRSPWAVGLDTGCVYGGSLTAFCRSTHETVSVPPASTHKPRDQHAIVEPRSPTADT